MLSSNYGRQLRRLLAFTLALAGSASGLASPVYAQAMPAIAPNWTPTGSLSTNRFGHTATLLTNGKVLVVGGGGFPCSGGFCFSTVNGSAELYDPATGAWSSAGNHTRRTYHIPILLQNGQVLVMGGANYGYDIGRFENNTSVELYDPAAGHWRPTGSFNRIVSPGLATLLPDGRVLAVGNSNLNDFPVVHAEVYDPATGVWRPTGAPSASSLSTMTMLPNGKVLSFISDAAELYDPTNERWASAGKLNLIRGAYSATLLRNGKVLVIGYALGGLVVKAELYDPTTGASANTADPGQNGTVTLLADGRVLIAGGHDFFGRAVGSAELYDPSTGTWNLTSRLNIARARHTATLLADGRVLVAGGVDGDGDTGTLYHESAELYSLGLASNPIDDPTFFVRRHYLDFLGREPDAAGLTFWTNEITSCGADARCMEVKRVNVSAAFFLSIEFQETGYLAYRMYKAAYGDAASPGVPGTVPVIRLGEFVPDTRKVAEGVEVGVGDWQTRLEANKSAFALEFVQRGRFLGAYPATMSPADLVNGLDARAGGVLSPQEREQLVAELTADDTTAGRASVLRKIAEDDDLSRNEFNRAFVLMQYFGYLRRNPDDLPDANFGGWQFWLDKLNSFDGNFVGAEMVKAFISSGEYRQRFGQ